MMRPSPDTLPRIGMIARWQPVHKGHQAVLNGLCKHGDRVQVGMGSANTYDYQNPFKVEEREAMLKLALSSFDNYTLIPILDLHDGPRWREMVMEIFGELDGFVTANPYVKTLLENDYAIYHPVQFVAEDQRVRVNGTMVRKAMAQNTDWQSLVPEVITTYIQQHKLDVRFRKEFGLQTLATEPLPEGKE